MTIPLALLTVALSLIGNDEPAIDAVISARLVTEKVAVGAPHEFVLSVEFGPGVDASSSGAPAPFLQLDVPPSVQLTGRAVETFRALSRNQFIQEPYELLLVNKETRIPFDLVSEPVEGATIGINVVAYVRPEGAESGAFLRRRLELPLVAGAQARAGDRTNSKWGKNEKLLQIGDKATPFQLPKGDGTFVPLADHLGQKNVIVTTYRAHW